MDDKNILYVTLIAIVAIVALVAMNAHKTPSFEVLELDDENTAGHALAVPYYSNYVVRGRTQNTRTSQLGDLVHSQPATSKTNWGVETTWTQDEGHLEVIDMTSR